MKRPTILAISLLATSFIPLPSMADPDHTKERPMPGAMMTMDHANMVGEGMKTMDHQAMAQKQAMMQRHIAKMEQHLANIERLLSEWVAMQKRRDR